VKAHKEFCIFFFFKTKAAALHGAMDSESLGQKSTGALLPSWYCRNVPLDQAGLGPHSTPRQRMQMFRT
jgi:hypothetical protein